MLLVAFGLCLPALAQGETSTTREPLVLTDAQGEYPLGLHLDILEDPGGELTFDQVASPESASRFVPSQEQMPVYGYTSSVFWLRLHFRNEASLNSQWMLEVNFPNLNYVDLYLPAEGGGYWVKQSGALRSFDTRDIPYYHVVFSLPLAYQDEQTFYIRVESGSSMTLAFTLWSPNTFAVNKITDMLFIGLFYGALLMMLGYHLFALYSLREANYLYFVVFLASSILFWATYEGVADQFLWPEWSDEKKPILIITMAIFFIASLKFSDVFLEQKTQSPKFHRLFNLFIGLWVLMIVIVPFFSYGFMAQITLPLILITPVIASLAGVYSWRKRQHQALFYLVSWLGFVVGLIAVELVRSGVLPSTPITERSYHAGLIWLVLMWSLALTDKIRLFKKETEDANRKLLQSQRQLSQTLEGMPLGVVVYGLDRRPAYANPRAVNILSNPERGIQAGIVGRRTVRDAIKYFSFTRVGTDQEYPVEQMPVWQAFEGSSASADDIEADLIDRRVPLEIWANPIKDETGRVESVVAAFQDITQRNQMQAELDDYRHQLEDLVEQRTEQLQVTNQRLNIEISERLRLENILRLRLEWLVVVNQVYQSVANPGDLLQAYDQFAEKAKNIFSSSEVFLAEIDPPHNELMLLSHTCRQHEHPDLTGLNFSVPFVDLSPPRLKQGTPFFLTSTQLNGLDGPLGQHYREARIQLLALVPLHCQDDIFGLLGLEFLEADRLFSVEEYTLIEKICLDITQVREKARLAGQAQALIAAEERNRLARDLHDSVTQMLFAASLIAEVLPQIWRRNPDQAQASLEELHRLTRGALAEMRTMLLELRPAAVIKTPLGELLAQLAEAITGRTNLPFQLFVEQTPRLPADVHISFYRIAQESLNNVVKHARAGRVSVSLGATPPQFDPAGEWSGEVVLVIRDDGCGFTLQEDSSQHLGLGIMRERAAAIGADLSVESQPGQGTTVTLTWHKEGTKHV